VGDRLKRRPVRLLLLGLLFAATAFALYAPALRSPFLFDDYTSIEANPRIAEVRNFLPPSGPRDAGYLSFALNHAASGLDPLPYHAVNVAIHALCALLVFLLVGSAADHLSPGGARAEEGGDGRNGPVALAAALLFLVHPVQTGAVSYVVQRFASLCTLFYLLSFACWLAASARYRRGGRFLEARHLVPYVASFLSALLAMKTKEIALTLPLAIAAWELLFRRKGAGAGERAVPAAYYLPVALSLLVVPAQLLSSAASPGELLGELERRTAETREIGRWEYLLTETRVVATYVRLFFLPAGQNLDYDYAVSKSLLEPAVLLSLAFHALVVAVSVRLYRRTEAGRILLVPFGVLWSYLALSVESGAVPIRDVIFEHRMYLPFAGMAAAATAAVEAGALRLAGERGRRALPVLLAAALLALSALTVARNVLWSDGLGIWRDAAEKSPAKARPRANLAALHFDGGRMEEAEREYVAALRLAPALPLLHVNLGNVYRVQGRRGEAAAEYRRALVCDPRFAEAHYGLGVVLAESGAREEGLGHLLLAVALSPSMHEAWVALANAEDGLGRKEEALAAYSRAIALRPDYALAWFNRGIAREGAGDRDGARSDFRKALELDPALAEARRRLDSPAP
jgi:tetratricopeptide (TPR) repeat protein